MKTTLSNCNYCRNQDCDKKVYRSMAPDEDCPIWIDPIGSFPLIELALSHPQGLHESLSSLDLEMNIERIRS